MAGIAHHEALKRRSLTILAYTFLQMSVKSLIFARSKKCIMNELLSHISIDPDIRFGKPCIKGTRISIGDILQWLASGMSMEEIMEDFPLLKAEHIRAALAFAANREAITKIVAA
jgi:uncharacterized protein (DUF433 family)